jgi:NTE family protein
LVVGSGALKCIAAFGAVKVLQREGIEIDMVVGCSGGSFCAVWFALGAGDPDEAALRFSQGWEGSFDSIDYRRLYRSLLPSRRDVERSFALLSDRRINASIVGYAEERTFADATLPLFLVATDAAGGERVVLSSGALSDAIRASIAIPLLLPPWPVAGKMLIDGGVSDPLPIDVAMREGADVIIAMGFEEHIEVSPRSGLLQQLMHLKSLTVNNLIRAQYAFYSATHHAEVILLTPQFDRPVGLRALHQVPYLLSEGERAAEAQMPYLRRLLGMGIQPRGSAA